jgi:DNA-binding MarR family transcriptional regulator
MNLEDVIIFQIEKTSKAARKYSQREFDLMGIDITVDQWVILKFIEENEGRSQKELADTSIKDAASITRILDILSRKGWVIREALPDNRRQYGIHLSKQGKAFITQNMELINRHRAKSLENFGQQEIEQLKEYLLRIQKNLK